MGERQTGSEVMADTAQSIISGLKAQRKKSMPDGLRFVYLSRNTGGTGPSEIGERLRFSRMRHAKCISAMIFSGSYACQLEAYRLLWGILATDTEKRGTLTRYRLRAKDFLI